GAANCRSRTASALSHFSYSGNRFPLKRLENLPRPLNLNRLASVSFGLHVASKNNRGKPKVDEDCLDPAQGCCRGSHSEGKGPQGFAVDSRGVPRVSTLLCARTTRGGVDFRVPIRGTARHGWNLLSRRHPRRAGPRIYGSRRARGGELGPARLQLSRGNRQEVIARSTF